VHYAAANNERSGEQYAQIMSPEVSVTDACAATLVPQSAPGPCDQPTRSLRDAARNPLDSPDRSSFGCLRGGGGCRSAVETYRARGYRGDGDTLVLFVSEVPC